MKFPVVLISMVLCLSAVAVYGSFIGTRDDKEMVYGSNVDGSVACFSENIHTKGKGRIERRILITSATNILFVRCTTDEKNSGFTSSIDSGAINTKSLGILLKGQKKFNVHCAARCEPPAP